MRRIDFTYRDFYRLIRNERGFSIDFDPCTRQPDSFHEEFCRAARHISSLATGKIYLMYSGGIDSEYVLDVYSKLGIEVIPVIVRLLPDYNSHDLEYAMKYCCAKGLDPIFIDIDFDDFVRSGKMLETMTETECGYYQLSSTLYAADRLDGTILVAGGDPYCAIDPITNEWNLVDFEFHRSWDLWFDSRNKNGTSMILGYTPEMVLSFLTDPVIVDVVNNRVPGKLGTFSSRVNVYNKAANLEPRTKFTGYEKIENSSIFQTPEMKQVLDECRNWNGKCVIPYQEMISRLLGNVKGPVSCCNNH